MLENQTFRFYLADKKRKKITHIDINAHKMDIRENLTDFLYGKFYFGKFGKNKLKELDQKKVLKKYQNLNLFPFDDFHDYTIVACVDVVMATLLDKPHVAV